MYTMYPDPNLNTQFTLGEDLGCGSTSRKFGFGATLVASQSKIFYGTHPALAQCAVDLLMLKYENQILVVGNLQSYYI